MRYIYKKRFLEYYDSLTDDEKTLVRTADKQIRDYYQNRIAPVGLRIKKLHQRTGEAVYEARPNLSLRIIWAERYDLVSFVLLGTHDDVHRYLKRL